MLSAPVYCKTFIGRATQLDMLRERYRAAVSGKGSLVLISGEAGTGKTRLLVEFADSLHEESSFFARASCFEYVQTPYGPFVDAVRTLSADVPTVWKPTQVVRDALALLMPELGEQRNTPAVESEIQKRRQLDALASAIACFASSRPIVLAIDDLHWADLASLEFLQHVVTKIEEMRALIVATFRTDTADAKSPLRRSIARLAPRSSVWQMELEPLSDDDMRRFMLTALEGRERPSTQVLTAIPRLAEGNPLVAEELLKNAVERTGRDPLSPSLPLSLQDAVLERLADFSDDDRLVLAYAAAIGRRFDPEFLAQTVERPITDVLRVLKRAIALQLIVEQSDEGTCYAFRHALTREVIARQLLAVEARPLHARIAQLIETAPDTAARVTELAYHWWEARDAAKAAEYNERAGDAAAAVFAHDDAALCYERAVLCTTPASRQNAAINEKLGSALALAGFPERAIAAMERAIAYYRREGEIEKASDLLLRVSVQHWELGHSESALTYASRASDALASCPQHPQYRRTLVRLGRVHALLGDTKRACEQLERAQALAGEAAVEFLADLYSCWGLIHALCGQSKDCIDAYRKAVAYADETTDLYAPIRARGNIGYSACCLGETDAAVRACEEAAARAHEKGMPLLESWALHNRAGIEIFCGTLPRARDLLDRALAAEMTVQSEVPDLGTTWIALLIALPLQNEEMLRRWGREDAVERAFVRGGQYIPQICASFAELYAQRGEPGKARELLHRAMCAVSAIGAAPWIAASVAMYGDSKDLPATRALLAEWSKPDNRAGNAFLALVDAYATRGDAPTRTMHAEEAASRFEAIGFSYYRAVALELADRRAEALEIYRMTGNVRDTQRLERALIPVNRRGRPKTALTAREREVAALVAAGKSNRAIAEDLFISERTVESHVESIFSKLGFSTRAQVGAYIGQPGPSTRSG
jgi:predicted ATPase/DNA-binding CsgD family transcriptional regulator